MKKRKKASCRRSQRSFFVTALMVYLLSTSLNAQQSINAAGGNLSGGEVSYSVGQVFYMNNSSSEASGYQGVQVYLVVSETDDGDGDGDGQTSIDETTMSVSIYPNPSSDYLHVSTTGSLEDPVSINLYNTAGELLQAHTVITDQFQLDINSYATGTYVLKVQTSTEYSTYKIIKN